MDRQAHWLEALIQCRNNICKQIGPLLETLNGPQPNLGIGAGGDPMKQIDLAAEETIVDTLQEQSISFTLISEESGIKEYGRNPHKVYITTDPIDGTTNLTRGIPFYATSIAVSTKPELSTVHTALVTDLHHNVTFTAQTGKGARRNGRTIRPSANTLLEEAVVGMDMNTFQIEKLVPSLTSLAKNMKHTRHLGANALELCYVADGTTDAFIDIRGRLRATDMAAAWLVIREAGAIITTPEGEPLKARLDPKQKVHFIAAANPDIHRTIMKHISHQPITRKNRNE
jgi:myo-inositol-1(or 4)-monophosphatase